MLPTYRIASVFTLPRAFGPTASLFMARGQAGLAVFRGSSERMTVLSVLTIGSRNNLGDRTLTFTHNSLFILPLFFKFN